MTICEEAQAIIAGERQDQYGSPEDSFTTIAWFWDDYLMARKWQHGGYLTPKDVALMLDLMKTARTIHGTDKRDNYADKVGYTLIAAKQAGFEP